MSDDTTKKDGLMQLMDTDAARAEVAETKASQAQLEAVEAKTELEVAQQQATARGKAQLIVDEIRAKLDELAPLLSAIPEPARTFALDVKEGVDLLDDALKAL